MIKANCFAYIQTIKHQNILCEHARNIYVYTLKLVLSKIEVNSDETCSSEYF